jgi:Kef-type K+ transport system membrane component KefB/mannitol/fructose-specific phosphotransferase system IIA component (Ntr-type)
MRKRIFILLILITTAAALFAQESDSVTEAMTSLVLQLGVLLFAVRLGGRLVRRLGIPSVLGELLAGVAIGPYALGSLPIPGFPGGLFPLESASLAVTPELYGFATVASIILLFSSGLETDLGLFLRYSVAGGLVGLGGVAVSFLFGNLTGVILLHEHFLENRSLFLGILSTATSVGITARILSDQKKMDSPEGVTILAAAVFDDVLGIILLAVVMGIVSLSGGGGIDGLKIAAIAGKAFGIWLGFTVLGLLTSKWIAKFLKLFKSPFDFSILSLGIALLLAGFFERQGLAMIIGAYITGLSLSKTDIAPEIRERIHVLYDFFVPVFFAVMGMMVNVREILSPPVLIFGAVYTAGAILAKTLGCGLPAMLMGFNLKGGLRIGAGMIPRGEVALIIAGIGLSSGVLDNQIFAVIILMTLVTTLVAPPLLSLSLKIPGAGSRKPVKKAGTLTLDWDFPGSEITDLVTDNLVKNLAAEGFYVQMMNIGDRITQARKDDISISITKNDEQLSITCSEEEAVFIKTLMFENLMELSDGIERLKASTDPKALGREIAEAPGKTDADILSLIEPRFVKLNLAGQTKEAVLTELVDFLDSLGVLDNRDEVLEGVFQREKSMSTGMEKGVALPHCKSAGIGEMRAVVGIKPEGIDFDSLDRQKSQIFIMVISPKSSMGPHIRFLASVTALLQDDAVRARLIAASTPEEVVKIFRPGK